MTLASSRLGTSASAWRWVGEHAIALGDALGEERALYGEWLYRRHTIAYEALPALLVGLDVWDPESGFAGVDERDAMLARGGLTAPPRLFEGVLNGRAELMRLLGWGSKFGASAIEGVVVRRLDPEARPRLAKVVRSAFAASLKSSLGRHT